ncbi:MAG: hypothetical protein LBE24_04230 [Methylobacillus sp.]|jgi:hypothetical protein|nr:hypothetical protein [Methylobacillus sp.]
MTNLSTYAQGWNAAAKIVAQRAQDMGIDTTSALGLDDVLDIIESTIVELRRKVKMRHLDLEIVTAYDCGYRAGLDHAKNALKIDISQERIDMGGENKHD